MGKSKANKRKTQVKTKVDLKIQQEINKNAINQRSGVGKKIMGALCERTEMVMVESYKFSEPLKAALKKFGISFNNVSVWQIRNKKGAKPYLGVINDDFGAAGLTDVEGKELNKVACSTTKSLSLVRSFYKSRFIKRQSTEERTCHIYLDGDGDVVVIRIQNIFSDDEVMSRFHFLQTHQNCGWSKGCSLSGHIISDEAFNRFKANPVALKAFFGRFWKEYEPLFVEVTANGNGTTGKLYYKNREGEIKKMQFGNYLLREIYDEKFLLDCLYHQKASSVLFSFGPLIFGGDEEKYLREYNNKPSTVRLNMAINHWEDGTAAPPSWHRDGIVNAACLASAMPSVGSPPLDSQTKHNCDAGAIAMEYGGYIYPYGHQDAIIFNGACLHAPTIPAPDMPIVTQRSKGKKAKKCKAGKKQQLHETEIEDDKKKRIGRHSFITFIKEFTK